MNIICATDDKYTQHCAIMLKSLFFNNDKHELNVYILTSGITTINKNILDQIATSKLHRVNFIHVKSSDIEYCPVRSGDHVSITAYFRILAPVLLKNLDKALYLDCDIIINNDIKSLYDIDIENTAIAAVTDEDYVRADKFERLGYNPDLGYFNSGVLLMNLNYWRTNKISKRCLLFIEENPDKCVLHDQDAMNEVLCKCKKEIDIKYNFQTGFILANEFKKIKCRKLSDKIKNITSENSYVIIHYTGYNKPWKASRHPYRQFYKFYKDMTVYRDIEIPESNLSVKERVYNLLVKLRLKKKINSYIIDDFLII